MTCSRSRSCFVIRLDSHAQVVPATSPADPLSPSSPSSIAVIVASAAHTHHEALDHDAAAAAGHESALSACRSISSLRERPGHGLLVGQLSDAGRSTGSRANSPDPGSPINLMSSGGDDDEERPCSTCSKRQERGAQGRRLVVRIRYSLRRRVEYRCTALYCTGDVSYKRLPHSPSPTLMIVRSIDRSFAFSRVSLESGCACSA